MGAAGVIIPASLFDPFYNDGLQGLYTNALVGIAGEAATRMGLPPVPQRRFRPMHARRPHPPHVDPKKHPHGRPDQQQSVHAGEFHDQSAQPFFGADEGDLAQQIDLDLPSPAVPTLDLPMYLGLLDIGDYEAVEQTTMDIDFDPLVASGRAGTRRLGIENYIEGGGSLPALFGFDNDYYLGLNDDAAAVIGCDLGCGGSAALKG